jgi:hypothetical protein
LTATNALTGSSITYPTSDGTNGQFLKTNGSGVLSFGDIPTQYTDSDARSAISAGTGISYDSSTGVITSTASGGVDGITSSANATAITIDSSERVGINTSSPSTELHVYSADQNALKVQTNTGINQIELANSTNSPTYLTQDSYGFQIKADENGWGGSNSFFSVKVKAAERMRISSDGYITAPNQVAFSVAKNNGYQTDDNVFVCDSQTGSRNHNDGSHYNTSNGRFTAPVAGRYWFSFSVQTHDSGGVVQAWVALRKNGSVVQYNLQHKTGGYHTRFDMSISLKLAANDYIEAYVGESGTSSGWQGSASEYNNFSGFLIG